jgi:hypothetical protein
MRQRHLIRWPVLAAFLVAAPVAPAGEPFAIDWYTIDAGGGFSAGATFELDGAIGQHDAGSLAAPLTGGAFELVGGFWPGAIDARCTCPGDVNGDGTRDGDDIHPFIACVLLGSACDCADVDGMTGLTPGDVTAFVDILLTGTACP